MRFLKNFRILFAGIIFLSGTTLFAQRGNEFWLAPPDITDLHNSPGGEPLYLLVSSAGSATTVTIDVPANGAFVPIVVTVQANKSRRINLTAFKAQLETRPTNTICNTGLHIVSTTPITCYYECANTNNTDIWALKGPNGLGTQFYIPLHKHAPFNNEASFASPHQAFASFDICATVNNTQVTIYSPTPVDGHAALQQFTITLNRGQTYSCGWTGANWQQPSTHPAGATVLSNQPVVVSIKDDSDHNPSGGCYDIIGDQIVPVNLLGNDYIAVKGSLNNTGDESVVIMATQNNTQIFVDGSATPVATLFAGEYFRIDIDSLSTSSNNALFIHSTLPIYAMHITGFGCEMGEAQLPPLNCAGSQQLNFMRDDAQTFYITLLCKAVDVNSFTITGPGTAVINPASFVTVPGTAGIWKAARIQYNTTNVPVDSTFTVTNSTGLFALGVVNGGASSGCKYGYFSEFAGNIITNAGPDQTRCANTTVTLAGTVTGTSTTGQWSSSGTGTFSPNNTTLNAVYTPSASDIANGSVTLTLISTGGCTPVSDQTLITFTPAPTSNAGPDQSKCRNNANTTLSGAVTVATGGTWSGGAGTFSPNTSALNAVYTPTAGELAAGSVMLTLTTTGNGSCNAVSDNMLITFTSVPVVNAGPDQTRCGNNPAATLAGTVSGASGGAWTGGTGSFNPSATALNAVYTPSAAEISAGSVTLTLSSTGNGTCNAVTDQVTIFLTSSPTANAGPDQTKCGNNPAATLAGSITVATGAQWTGGLGSFSPNNTALNAVYTSTASEIASGSVTLTLTTTGNGTCNAVTDQVTVFFTGAPTVNAGPDQTKCRNNPNTTLSGSVTVATGGTWSGGAGTFTPNANTLNAVYTPSAGELAAGSVTLTLTTSGNGTCNAVSDNMIITFSASPVANAGPDQTKCGNNPSALLAGSITGATGGAWSGGAGTFSPSSTALNATYTPTASEISAGSVTLTLTTTGNGTCNAVTDQVSIFYSASPTANAGSDQTLCANNNTATLTATITVATGVQWSGGSGTYLPNSATANITYTPSASEISNGSVTLTVTTTGNGTCNAVTDAVTIFYTPSPTVNAGNDISVCAENPVANLNGAFTIAGGAVWSGGSGIFSPSNTALNASYSPTPAEISSGSVLLTLTTTGNGTCSAVSDDVQITINPSPVAGFTSLSGNLCSGDSPVQLSATPAGGTFSGPGVSGMQFDPAAAGAGNHVLTYSVMNANGCTGTATITATVNAVSSGSQNITICQGQSFTVGTSTYSASGTYTDHFTNAVGCDSAVTTVLNVTAPNSSAQNPVICQGQSFIVGTNAYTSTGNYSDVFATAQGCDSIVYTNLLVNPNTSLTQNLTICEGQNVVVGPNTYSAAGTYSDTLINANGCDSIITTNLDVYQVDTNVVQVGNALVSTANNASYQWIDCSTSQSVPGATGQSFTPIANGNYAVVATENGCTDTSSCYTVIVTGANGASTLLDNVTIYPNPAVGEIHIAFAQTMNTVTIRLYTADGKFLREEKYSGTDHVIFDPQVASGNYLLDIETGDGRRRVENISVVR
jgi:hypothetical protein